MLHFIRKYYFVRRLAFTFLFLKWILYGRPDPPPHLFKRRIIKEYAKRFGLDIFVETGTYLGDMVYGQKGFFKELYSIELDPTLCSKARKRFSRFSHVHILCGDSGKVLPELLVSIKKPCLFWLDAHYSGGITARSNLETPITQELEAILKRTFDDVILIDDARCFVGQNGYPTLKQLEEFCIERRPNCVFNVENDIIRIHKSH